LKILGNEGKSIRDGENMWFYHVLPSNIQVLSDEQSNMGLFFGRTPRDGNLFTGKMMSHQFLCYHIGENGKPKWDVKLRIHVLEAHQLLNTVRQNLLTL
jgi:hypothetical protein